jgi:ABC-2 type transport system permease protein
MISSTYLRLELLRTVRNRRFAVLSLGFPLVLYLVFAGPQRNNHDFGGSGIDAPLYYMVGLAAFGTMSAVLSSGARIAAERSIGWNRQLRLTPLPVSAYFAAKVITAYALALITLVVLDLAGTALGVRLSAGRWLEMTALILVGLIPFAAIGVFIGHRISVEAIGPAIGGTTALFALLGGTWYPLQDGTLRDIGRDLPSYWLVQASHISLGGSAWGRHGWLVVAAWTAGFAVLAARAYRNDTQRA